MQQALNYGSDDTPYIENNNMRAPKFNDNSQLNNQFYGHKSEPESESEEESSEEEEAEGLTPEEETKLKMVKQALDAYEEGDIDFSDEQLRVLKEQVETLEAKRG